MNIDWGVIIHAIVKVLTGIIIVPLAVLLATLWPRWEEKEGFPKYFYGFFILTLAGLIYFPAKWWEGY